MTVIIIAFVTGALISAALSFMFFSHREYSIREELVKLRAKSETTENIQELIKRDFVQLANETIKNEQEDLRKQNRETLEEKIKPLTKELGEFKEKVEKFMQKRHPNAAAAYDTDEILRLLYYREEVN